MNRKLVLSVFAFAGMAMAAGKTYTVKLYSSRRWSGPPN